MATKKATLSDMENLAVGAAGGILETGIQSAFLFSLCFLYCCYARSLVRSID
jgi:hypothetical protein